MTGIVYSQTSRTVLIDRDLNFLGSADNPLSVQAIPAAVIETLSGDLNTAGDHLLVPGVAGKRIRVFAISLFAPTGSSPVRVLFSDGVGGPTLFSALAQSPNQSIFAFGQATALPTYLFGTSPGNGLNMNLSAASEVMANLSYSIEA